MRTALLIGIPRKGPFQVLAGPEVPLDKQIATFKELAGNREHANLREVQLWISDAGVTKRMKFRDPKVEAKTQSTAAAAEEAEKARLAQVEKDKADKLTAEKAEQEAVEKRRLEAEETARLARAAETAAANKGKSPKK